MSQVTWGRYVQFSAIESKEGGTHHFTRSPKYDMDACMATLFGRDAWDLYWEVGRAKS